MYEGAPVKIRLGWGENESDISRTQATKVHRWISNHPRIFITIAIAGMRMTINDVITACPITAVNFATFVFAEC